MPLILNNLLHTSSQTSSARHAEEAQNIGEHPLSALQARLKDTLEEYVTNTFNQSDPVVSIGLNNLVMLSALQAVNGVLSEKGIHLPAHGRLPAGVEQLLDTALEQLRNDRAKYPLGDAAPTEVSLHLEDIEKLQRSIDTSKTPLANVPAEHRWRLCLDPAFVDLVETHITGAQGNKLLPFMMDSEPHYLHGLLNGWATSMRSLKVPLNAKLLTTLHRAACSGQGVDKKEYIRSSFGLTMGKNMTPEGRNELLTFARELRNTLPGYVVTESREDFVKFDTQWNKTQPGNPVPAPPEPTGHLANAAHVEISFATLAQHMDGFISDHEKKMPHCKTEDERLENIVDLCQKLERLHPFPDGNARSFAILALNHLLVRNGMPLTMLSDPNILDGWSRAQVVTEVKVGQQRVAAYSSHQGGTAQAAKRKHWHDSLKNRLNNMF